MGILVVMGQSCARDAQSKDDVGGDVACCLSTDSVEAHISVTVVDSVDVMLGYWDRDLRCRFANAAYEIWFGRSRREMLGISLKELLGPLYELNLPHILGALAGEVQVFEREIRLPNGTIRHSLASYYPVIRSGIVEGFVVQVTDVSQMKRLEFELREARKRAELMATHDPLTGLPNRVLLLDRMRSAITRAEHGSNLVGVVAIDLDEFKTVNDTWGHATGDAFLREVANRMKTAVRDTDTITRLGGDEFIYLANEIESFEALGSIVRQIQLAVCQPFRTHAVSIVPSLSFGLAGFPLHGATPSELLAKADSALYQAKRSGKNCAVVAMP